jgi:hypothetical protein
MLRYKICADFFYKGEVCMKMYVKVIVICGVLSSGALLAMRLGFSDESRPRSRGMSLAQTQQALVDLAQSLKALHEAANGGGTVVAQPAKPGRLARLSAWLKEKISSAETRTEADIEAARAAADREFDERAARVGDAGM